MAGLFGGSRQQQPWLEFLRQMQAAQMGAGEGMAGGVVAPVGPVAGQPLPPVMQETIAPKGGGLFGGSRAAEAKTRAAAVAKAAEMDRQPNQRQTGQGRRYGMGERLYDFFADYNGAPTIRDAMGRQSELDRTRAEAAQFGADFGKAGMNMTGANADQTYALMARQIAERQARGEDVGQLITLADNLRGNALASALANSSAIPENLRPAARAAPSAGVALAIDQNGQDLYGSPGSPGGVWRGSKAGGDFKQVIEAQPGWDWIIDPEGNAVPRPGGPADPVYGYESSYNHRAGEVAATPSDPVDPLSEGQVVASVLQKALTAGSPDALNPAERAIFDKAVAQSGGIDALTALLLGGGGQGAPQARPGAGGGPYGQSQQRGGGSGNMGAGTQANPARPQTQADYDRLPRGAYFIDEDGLKVKE